MAWRYNFSSNTVIANLKNAFCFTIIKSFVDASTLSPSEIQFFVARSLGLDSIAKIQENKDLKTYVDYLVNSWSKTKSIDFTQFKSHLSNYKEY